MRVEDIWQLEDGTKIKIGGNVYEYNNIQGMRSITDVVIGDTHWIGEWYTGDEEFKVCEQD